MLDVRVIKKNGRNLRPRLRGYYVKLPPLEVGDAVELRSRELHVARHPLVPT